MIVLILVDGIKVMALIVTPHIVAVRVVMTALEIARMTILCLMQTLAKQWDILGKEMVHHVVMLLVVVMTVVHVVLTEIVLLKNHILTVKHLVGFGLIPKRTVAQQICVLLVRVVLKAVVMK